MCKIDCNVLERISIVFENDIDIPLVLVAGCVFAIMILNALRHDGIGEAHKQGIFNVWSTAQAFVDDIH